MHHMKWKGGNKGIKVKNNKWNWFYIYILPFFLAVHSSSPLSFNHDGSLQYCMIVFKERKKERSRSGTTTSISK